MDKTVNISPNNPFNTTQDRIHSVAMSLGRCQSNYHFIILLTRDVQFNQPARSYDGSDELFLGRRVNDNETHHPSQCGIHYHILESVDYFHPHRMYRPIQYKTGLEHSRRIKSDNHVI